MVEDVLVLVLKEKELEVFTFVFLQKRCYGWTEIHDMFCAFFKVEQGCVGDLEAEQLTCMC